MEQNKQSEERAQVLRTQYGDNVESRAAECRAADAEGMVIEGYAAVFNQVTNIGHFREVIDPSAFDGHLNDDVRLLLNHDGAPMARTSNGTLKLTTDETGLHYRAELVDTQSSRDLYAMIKRGDISESSFAFTIENEEVQDDGVRRVMQVGNILDVSPVTYPAYATTSVQARKMEQPAQPEKQREIMNVELSMKDLLQLRADYMAKRQAIKDDAVKEDRDLTDVDVRELERLADEVSKLDRQVKVMREDQKLAESAILAGGNTASRSEQREMDKIAQNYSLTRGIQQVYRGRQLTGVEAEMTEEANKEAQAAGLNFRGQLSIPSKMLTRAAGDAGELYTSADPGQGFVPTNVGAAVEALRAPNVLERAGITVLNGLTGDLKIPKVSAGSTIAEKAEGAEAATSAMDMATTTLTPRRATAFTLVTEQLMMQGGAAVEALVVRDLADAVTAFIEKQSFIDILDGIATNGDAIEDAFDGTAAEMLTLEANAIAAGVNPGDIAVIANSFAHGKLAAQTEVLAVQAALDRVANRYLGYPYYVSGNCPHDATASNEYGGGVAILGDFARGAALGYFGGVDVVINPYTFDINNQVRISIHRHFDCDVLQDGALHARYNDGAA